MGIYRKRVEDKQYRIVNLFYHATPDFEPIPPTVEFEENQVLEVEKEDGTTEIVSDGKREEVQYQVDRQGGHTLILIPEDIGLGRIWLEYRQNKYKVPLQLTKYANKPNMYVCMISGSSTEIVLTGDKYFNTKYKMIRV